MALPTRKRIVVPSSPSSDDNRDSVLQKLKRAKPNDIDGTSDSEEFAVMIEKAEAKAAMFKMPDCPICLELLSLPTVDSMCCLKQMCEQCALQWKLTGNDKSKSVACPLCNETPFTFQLSHVFNNFLGSREVPCPNASNGCPNKVAINDLQLHVDKFCEFVSVRCTQEVFGCLWAGVRADKAKHEMNCVHRESAKMREAWATEELHMVQKLTALQEKCQNVEIRIDQAIAKFQGFVTKKIKEFEHVQQLHLNPITKRYMLKTTDGEHALQVRKHDSKYKVVTNMLLRLVVTAESGRYVLSVTARDPELRYPFMFVGYIACLNRGMPTLKSANHFAIRFGNSKQVAEIMAIPESVLELGVTETGSKKLEAIIVQIVAAAF